MNIVYGICGEGYGHASHALTIADYLQKKGNRVLILTYGRAYDILEKKFNVRKIEGLHIICESGKISVPKTIFTNFFNLVKLLFEFRGLEREIDKFHPDFFITDMEPLSSFLANKKNLPLISLSNQNRFLACKINSKIKNIHHHFFTKLITRLFVIRADYYITLSFSDLSKRILKNHYIVSPILRPDILNLKPTVKNKVLVYLTKKDENVLNMLKKIDENFVVFGYDVEKKEGNLYFRKKEKFLEEFKDSKAIISNSGFTSVGEALYLKKPYFAIPLRGHFEQIYNAEYIKEKGFGQFSDRLKKEDIENFLKNLDEYRKNLSRYKMDRKKIFGFMDLILRDIER